MAKEPKKTNHAASLQRRQFSGIHEIVKSRRDEPKQAGAKIWPNSNANCKEVKSKSLLDRMTAPDGTKPATNEPKEPGGSSRKRKRQRNRQLDGDHEGEEYRSHPAKRTISDSNKPGADTEHENYQPETKRPRLWQHIKSKKFDNSESALVSTDKQPPKTGEPEPTVANDKGAKSLTPSLTDTPDRHGITHEQEPYPSPPANGFSPTSRKRVADALDGKTQNKRKKLRPNVIEKRSNSTPDERASLQPLISQQPVVTLLPVDAATAKHRGQTHTARSAPVVINPDLEHTYKDYDDDSIPILYAAQNRGDRPKHLQNNPSLDLQCCALAVLESSKGFTANDLGRPNVTKKGRTKIIDDLDLYFMQDHKVYVATERGLLLVADYLKLSGVPDTTPVRFNGIKPPYVKASINKRCFRWVSSSTYDPVADENERHRTGIPPGDLGLLFGEMVEIWERDPITGRVFGKCRHGGQTGWFDLENTVATRKELPPIEPWDETVFEEKDFKFSKNDPPAPAAALASLKYVKTYRCWQAAAPHETQSTPTPTPKATPTPDGYTPSKTLRYPPSVQPSPTPNAKETKEQNDSLSINATASVQVGDVPKLEPSVQDPASATNNEVKSMDCSSSEARSSAVAKVDKDVNDDGCVISRNTAIAVPEKAGTSHSCEDKVVGQTVDKEGDAVSNAGSNKSSVQRSIHDRSFEDEVDWDEYEL
ncbi:hypothetical protein IQ06DRAFT_348915 [Phaeosphaeriaceae sp. SRC1lsM3a]|nr:hypothetical protein IQ06DRAFT_348915 [Stagonospora sp. SRC1lsM3a]